MKYAINMQAIKVLSITALLISATQTVCSVPVVGKDVPALQEALSKLKNSERRELKKNITPNIKWNDNKNKPYIDMPNKDLRSASATIKDRSLALRFANFAGSNLTGANLEKAHFLEANLTNATLTNANLTGASLSQANLTNANLTNAILTDAILLKAIFSGVKGLTAEQKAYARSQGALNVPD